MSLSTISNETSSVNLTALGLPENRSLIKEVQTRLGDLGLLDPPADGQFGPVSRWALGSFKEIVRTHAEDGIGPATARKLLSENRDRLFPIVDGPDALANRLVRTIHRDGHWLNMHPACKNIIYVEGINPDGTRNIDAPNVFNDLRLVLSFIDGVPSIVERWEATTEPGEHFTIHPMNPGGAARIAFGQFKSWRVGTHMNGSPSSHEALVQIGEVTVHRDLNKDYERTGDSIDVGAGFGINQHWGYDHPIGNIGRASAGCLVGRTKQGHRDFMDLIKTDPRYLATAGYTFMTTVLDGGQLAA